MGHLLFDQYSLLHFAVGIIAYFWEIPFYLLFFFHILFEYSENTTTGMFVINKYFKNIWPGGKPRADTLINSIGDTCSAIIGWIIASIADKYAKRYGWYIEYVKE